jgi:type VI secretion system protein ImpM
LVGFIGKIPACGDFVRQHIGNKVSSELERWLSASSQNLYHGKHELGPGCMRFVFSAAGCDDVAVGSLVKSQDRVGRSYPLAIFTSLSASDAMTLPAALPLAYDPFFSAAEQLLQAASNLELDALRDGVASLRAPSANEHNTAQQKTTAALASARAMAVMGAALSGQPEAATYYALLTLCTATSAVQLAPPAAAPTVLDCPLERELGPSLWLSLTAARLRWTQGALSCVWTQSEPARLLLALGPAPDQLLAFSATMQHSSTRLWPVTTARSEAIERARIVLAPQLSALEAGSVAELSAQVARVGC